MVLEGVTWSQKESRLDEVWRSCESEGGIGRCGGEAEWYLLLGRVELLSGAADGALPLLPQCLHVSLQLPELS